MSPGFVPGFASSESEQKWVWWNSAVTESLDDGDFDLKAWTESGNAMPAAGRGSACRIVRDDTDWFLRHYRRGGLIGKLLHDQYWWRGVAPSRVVREMNVTHRLGQLGLPVPTVVGGRLVRSGLIYRADLITKALPCQGSMADQIASLSESQWALIGATIAEFHKHGLWHADLNAHNIQLSENKVWLIDFDRAVFKGSSANWQQQNLQRLWRSVCKISDGKENAPVAGWDTLLAAYKKVN